MDDIGKKNYNLRKDKDISQERTCVCSERYEADYFALEKWLRNPTINLRIERRFNYFGIVCAVMGAVSFAILIAMWTVFAVKKKKTVKCNTFLQNVTRDVTDKNFILNYNKNVNTNCIYILMNFNRRILCLLIKV